MNKLKPCPFCGSDKLRVDEIDRYCVCVTCEYCGCDGPVGTNPKEASVLWNVRSV